MPATSTSSLTYNGQTITFDAAKHQVTIANPITHLTKTWDLPDGIKQAIPMNGRPDAFITLHDNQVDIAQGTNHLHFGLPDLDPSTIEHLHAHSNTFLDALAHGGGMGVGAGMAVGGIIALLRAFNLRLIWPNPKWTALADTTK